MYMYTKLQGSDEDINLTTNKTSHIDTTNTESTNSGDLKLVVGDTESHLTHSSGQVLNGHRLKR